VNDQRWSWSGLLPYFKRTETFYPPPDQERMDVTEAHGFDGPIKVGHAFWFRGLMARHVGF
jgi:choline dehydrogenase-like flavoprotein